MISVEKVTYAYQARDGTSHPALHDLTLQMEEGEYVAIVGANGSGKSTLARHLNALLLPDQGRVTVAGLDTREPKHHPEIRRTVGMVFQRPDDQVVATVAQYDVAFGPENLGLPRDEIRERVRSALETVGLWEERTRPPTMLSAGQMQRLALAGVLAMRPRCIIFDEATAMLDPVGKRTVRQLMAELNRQGLTILTITHVMEEALDADRVLVMNAGGVALDGAPEAVFAQRARLQDLGLEVPMVARLADTLRSRLPTLPTQLYTVDELVAALGKGPGHDTAALPPTIPDSGQETPIIEATDLGHVYMRETPFARRALDHVDLAVREAGAHGLIGATGAGKSTLLQHLNGLLRPQEGAVRVDGFTLRGGERAAPDDVRAMRHMVGLVFQMPETQIFEQYVGDEIAYGPRLAGLDGEALRERVRWAMSLVGLDFEGFKDRLTFALSGGEKRKVALASILALRPRVLLLDEPTAGLDPASRRELLAQLRQFAKPGDTSQAEGMTLVLSSHQMEDIAALCDRVTVMSKGTTVADGSTAEIYAQGDRLRAWGLEQPIATRVAEALVARGWPLPAGIVDEDRLAEALIEALDA